MDELVGRLAAKAGTDGVVAEATIGIVAGFPRKWAVRQDSGPDRSHSGGRKQPLRPPTNNAGFRRFMLRRFMGGVLMATGSRLTALGPGMGEIQGVARELSNVRPRQNRSGSDGKNHFRGARARPLRVNAAFG